MDKMEAPISDERLAELIEAMDPKHYGKVGLHVTVPSWRQVWTALRELQQARPEHAGVRALRKLACNAVVHKSYCGFIEDGGDCDCGNLDAALAASGGK